ncbi:hypothetical protein LINGRAHAP2_LOCUS14651, partial [Linum grandiflorum]
PNSPLLCLICLLFLFFNKSPPLIDKKKRQILYSLYVTALPEMASSSSSTLINLIFLAFQAPSLCLLLHYLTRLVRFAVARAGLQCRCVIGMDYEVEKVIVDDDDDDDVSARDIKNGWIIKSSPFNQRM